MKMNTQRIRPDEIDVRTYVRDRYGKLAESNQPAGGADCGCSSSDSSCCGSDDPIQLAMVEKLYQDPDALTLPQEVTDLSLGCGDPVTLASLEEDLTVLDLGSGGGIDCFLAAKKVGPGGKVIGVDMTPAMIDRARANKTRLGAENVEFRLGEIEHLPLSDEEVDVIISNCVINLSPDKPQVFREAFRVMRPGGRLAVSDIVTDGPLPAAIKDSLSSWAGCVAGAMDAGDYIAAIQEAGFVDVQLTPVYWDQEMIDAAVDQLDPQVAQQVEEAKKEGKRIIIMSDGIDAQVVETADADNLEEVDFNKTIFSAKVTARKPQR
jgi:arsenite methyltransferase